MMDELKEGTVFNFENEEYVLYKLIEYMNNKYIVSLGYKNPKDVKIFEYKIEEGKVLIGLEDDDKIKIEILKKILN